MKVKLGMQFFANKIQVSYFEDKMNGKFGYSKISRTFAPHLRKTGCSAVRLAHLLWEQGVPGSNPGTPTREETICGFLFFVYICHKNRNWL